MSRSETRAIIILLLYPDAVAVLRPFNELIGLTRGKKLVGPEPSRGAPGTRASYTKCCIAARSMVRRLERALCPAQRSLAKA
jgi:hypothetical protein